ncbi:MAG TPA: fatty acid desaturase [Elusimicrobiota bacterium]|jgi:beta-carotene hydroxylase|nr:fatty acid desaturase [Elusimicrobiota bacterium]
MSLDVRAVRPFELRAGETAWPTVALCLGALLVQGASTAAALRGIWPAAAAVLLNAACAYAQFTVAHDATHRSLSRVGWLNDAFGWVATLVLWGPFDAIRRNHLHHHAHTNDPAQDPDYWVAGETWLSTGLRCLTTLQAHYWSYLTRLRRRDAAFARALFVLALILSAHVWAWREGRLLDVLLYWTLPAQLGVAGLAVTFDYWPHRPHTARGRLRDTANILPAWLDPFFLRQNLHAVHHLFPQLPWYRYREALAVLEPDLRRAGVPQWGLREALAKLRPGPLPS